MIEPKKKRSINQKHIRHSTWQTLTIKKLCKMATHGPCSNCGAQKLSHRVCRSCGFYNGKQILVIKTKADKSQIIDA